MYSDGQSYLRASQRTKRFKVNFRVKIDDVIIVISRSFQTRRFEDAQMRHLSSFLGTRCSFWTGDMCWALTDLKWDSSSIFFKFYSRNWFAAVGYLQPQTCGPSVYLDPQGVTPHLLGKILLRYHSSLQDISVYIQNGWPLRKSKMSRWETMLLFHT